MTAPFDLVSFANGLLASQRPGKPRVEPGHRNDPDSHECRSCFGYGYFDEEERATLDKRGRKCLDCGGVGFVRDVKPVKCSACSSLASRRDADDVTDMCDFCGEASDDQKRDREKRQRRMAEREEI